MAAGPAGLDFELTELLADHSRFRASVQAAWA